MPGTLLDAITGALTAIGMLGQGQTPSPEDGALGLRQANLILSSSQAQRLMLFTVSTKGFPLIAGQADYTLGPTGSIISTRPIFVESGQINVFGTGVWLPMSILDKQKWDSILNRNNAADVPEQFWPEYTYPNIGLHFNPAPLAAVNVRLGCWEAFTQFVSVFDQIANAFPPEYEEWMEAKLAERLAPFYDQPVTPDIAGRAGRAEAVVMAKNAQGLGGALNAGAKFDSPNLGQPLPPAGPVGQ